MYNLSATVVCGDVYMTRRRDRNGPNEIGSLTAQCPRVKRTNSFLAAENGQGRYFHKSALAFFRSSYNPMSYFTSGGRPR